MANFPQKKSLIESLISYAREQSIKISEIEGYLKRRDLEPMTQGKKLYSLISRNEFSLASLVEELPRLRRFVEENGITGDVIEQVEIQIKYKGYIERENSWPRNSIGWKTSRFPKISISTRSMP